MPLPVRYAILGVLLGLGILAMLGAMLPPAAHRIGVALDAAEQPPVAPPAAAPPPAALPPAAGGAKERAQEPSQLIELLDEIVPPVHAALPVRPPFQPARYDLGLGREAAQRVEDGAPAESLKRLEAERTLSTLQAAALARQKRLAAAWRDLENKRLPLATPDDLAAWELLSYAMGTSDPQSALAAARKAGPEARFRWARLLLAECRFEEAITELAALAAPSGDKAAAPPAPLDNKKRVPSIRELALVLLVTHQAEREVLSKSRLLVPLSFDLQAFLASRANDPTDGPLLARLRKEVAPRTSEDDESGQGFEGRSAVEDLDVELLEIRPWDGVGVIYNEPRWLASHRLEKTWLVTHTNEMVLYRRDDRPIAGPQATFQLQSIFHGPIELRLYRFPSPDDIESLSGAELARLKPERQWTTHLGGIADNNVGPLKGDELEIKLDELQAGHYLMTAQARYAPLLAACQFSVSDVALYLHVGRNQGAVVAVNRRDASPRANLPLTLRVLGLPQIAAIRKAEQIDEADAEAFVQGFYQPPASATEKAGEAETPPAKPEEDPALTARRQQAKARGVASRTKYPDFKQVRELTTDDQGHASFGVDLGRVTYRYEVQVGHQPPAIGPVHEDGTPVNDDVGLARASVTYAESEPTWVTRSLAWTAQPVYRPGDTVHFKGIVRQFNGEFLVDGPGGLSQVPIKVEEPGGKSIWQGTCAVSEFGTIEGSFPLPPSARLGRYAFEVNGRRTAPSGAFTVSAFRVPTYRVRIVPDRERPRNGGRLTGEVLVEYYSGKPASGAEVALHCQNDSRELTTDLAGRARFSFPLAERAGDFRCTLYAAVSDISGQTYQAVEHVRVEAEPFRVEIQEADGAPRPAAWSEPGFTREFCITVNSWSGTPIVGASVAVEGNRKASITDADGVIRIAVPVTADGRHERFNVTVTSKGEVVTAAQPATPSLDPKSDKAEFVIGSLSLPHAVDAGQSVEVRFRLLGPVGEKATVALFAQNSRLLASRAMHLAPGEHVLSLPTQPDWAPSLQVRLVAFDGREHRTAEGRCFLRPREKFLTLSATTDKAEYRPGEPCTVVIQAVDFQNRPVPRAEIGLGVVDAALYDIRKDATPDLQQYFHEYHQPDRCRERYDTTEGWWRSRSYLLGPRYAWGYYSQFDEHHGGMRRAMLASYGGNASSEGSQPLAWRSDFRTTAHWVTNLVTDARGQAKSTFPFPSGVTSWRFTARGVTADTRVGEVRMERKTLLPLSIDLALPRAIREGDQIQIPVVLYNHLNVARSVAGATQIGGGPQAVWSPRTLSPRGVGRFDLPFTAGKTPVKLAVRVRDADRKDEDGVVREVIPLPRTLLQTRAMAGLLDQEVRLATDLGGPPTEEGLTIEIQREPGFAGPVQSALADLIDYPYGCVEQTMSRFMPALVADRAMRKAGIENPTSKNLDEIFAKGLGRLGEFQHQDGGWGWWEHDRTNEFMTAYVLLGLAMCREAEREVPQSMISRGRYRLLAALKEDALQATVPGCIGEVDLPAYASYALARLLATDRVAEKQNLEELKSRLKHIDQDETRAKRGVLSRILLAHAWLLLDERAKAAERLEELAPRVDLPKLSRPHVQQAAALLELGHAIQPGDPRWVRLADRLVNLRTGTGWGDTLTSSAAVRGLSTLVQASEPNERPVAVLVDGREAGQLTREAARLKLSLKGGESVLLRPEPGCPDRYTARLTGRLAGTRKPGAAPLNGAQHDAVLRIRVSTQVPPLVNEAGEPLPTPSMAPDAQGRLRVPLGRTVELRCVVELAKELFHTRLTIPRPCGVELVRASGLAEIAGAEERDDAFHFFIEHWEAGSHEIRLLVRAEVAGTLSSPWPQLEPMYADPLSTAVDAVLEWRVEAKKD